MKRSLVNFLVIAFSASPFVLQAQTANNVTKYTGTGTATTGSTIYDNGSTVSIGTSTATPYTINSSAALFPSATPRLEIWPGVATGAYSELMTIRHPYVNSSAVSRQLGMVFKMSDESTSGESTKMGGMMLESSDIYGNYPSLNLLTNNARRLTILSGGNVGIGNTTPTAKLNISGGGVTTGLSDIGTTLTQKIQTANPPIALGIGYVAADIPIIQSFNDVNHTANNFSLNPFGGNVGIGTTIPDAKLTVNGAIHAKEVNVTSNVPGPDYVFKKTYKLRPLSEVRQYINANSHLPEIPSAKTMEQGGIKVGEMNMLLLKKVEELTLYLIDKDQQMQMMQKKLDALIKKSETGQKTNK